MVTEGKELTDILQLSHQCKKRLAAESGNLAGMVATANALSITVKNLLSVV